MANKQSQTNSVTIFYDGACPICVKDRRFYERLAGKGGDDLIWLDISNQHDLLKSLGIEPLAAIQELHIQLSNGQIVKELDAYIHLMQRIWLLKPIAWLISLPIIRPWLANLYHRKVNARLKRQGRL